jgi:predicted DNA-binding transcriptional regulator AlpA
MEQSLSPLLRENEVEQILGVHRGWAAKDRLGNANIPFIKIRRVVRYRESDVRAFIEKSVRRSTSDVDAAA